MGRGEGAGWGCERQYLDLRTHLVPGVHSAVRRRVRGQLGAEQEAVEGQGWVEQGGVGGMDRGEGGAVKGGVCGTAPRR